MDRLISEQTVFKIIDNLKVNFTCYDSVTLDEVASHVKAIPSAEPKTGHWIVNECVIYCSECGCGALYDKVYPGESVFGKAIRVKSTFCPTCGAKMEVKE